MRHLHLFIVVLLFAAGCRSAQDTAVQAPVTEIEIPQPEPEQEVKAIYNPSRTLHFDLLHTKLDVSFDFSKSRLNGKAWLTLKPYFYPQDTLVLDAKGFDIHKINLQKNGQGMPLQYRYDSLQLFIALDRTYLRTDSFRVYIEYTAKPDERETGGSEAITSDKGLYFIDPLDTVPGKPTQIWTQGETEANSAWFPTMDTPNEKTTQELCMTVPDSMVTLSNGILQFSRKNPDGTRTDCWKQDLPHTPYLVMMAVGKYEIIKDKWRELDVHYYMEPEFAPYARDIFGNTPEMIEFYSMQLGVTYPWDKYHQVVVRDYVSGAMENTTAVIFGEFMNQTDRELLDGDQEAIIAHELYHHWFGDLVTTESWANLPLNEAFATYGEYLWIEHKYGRDAADEHSMNGLYNYLAESRQKQVDLIRFDYEDKEDMFDSHSYAKGGRVLHMLRKYTGDEAFFTALRKYLNDNRFGTAEIHDLRMAFEAVTGEDLNWFFNQWFLASGHPELQIETDYDTLTKEAVVIIRQVQTREETPLYRLPVAVDIWYNGQAQRFEITADDRSDTFRLAVPVEPSLIYVDAEDMLLAEKDEEKTAEELAFQYRHVPLFAARLEAVEDIAETGNDSLARIIIFEALNDDYKSIREVAIKQFGAVAGNMNRDTVMNTMRRLAESDPASLVRAAAVAYLSVHFEDNPELAAVYRRGLRDSSYAVLGASLNALVKTDREEAMQFIAENKDMNPGLLSAIASIYAAHGDATHHAFYIENLGRMNSFAKYTFLNNYRKYLSGQDETVLKEAVPVLHQVAVNETAWWLRLGAIQPLLDIYNRYTVEVRDLEKALAETEGDSQQTAAIENQLMEAKNKREGVRQLLLGLKQNEENPNLQKILNYIQ